MEHIQDIYKEKPELIENLLKNHVSKINLKVDGKPFQVLYNEETDELEFHGRSGNETTVGPLITDIDRYFSKFVNDAIRHIEDRADLFKKYKFMTIEIIDNELLLTSIITKSGEFVNSPKEIRKIADELETEVMPTLWEGQLSDAQIKVLMEIIKSGEVPTKGDFIKVVKALFDKDPNFPKKLIMANTEFIEGIVFFFDVKGKIVEYKLVDPAFRAQSAGYKASSKEEKDKNKETYNKLYEFYLDWVEKNGEKLADNHIHSIELNFIKMMKDPKIYNKVMNMASGIRINNIARYGVQLDRTTPEMAKEIRKNGDVYKTLYEIFFNMFKKPKKRNYTINKEFQMKVNDAIALFEVFNTDLSDEYLFEAVFSNDRFGYKNEKYDWYHYPIAVLKDLLKNDGLLKVGKHGNEEVKFEFKKSDVESLLKNLENGKPGEYTVEDFNKIIKNPKAKSAWTSICKSPYSGKGTETVGQYLESFICYLFNTNKDLDSYNDWMKANNIDNELSKDWSKSCEKTVNILNNLCSNSEYIAYRTGATYSISDKEISMNEYHKLLFEIFSYDKNNDIVKAIKRTAGSSKDKWNPADIILIKNDFDDDSILSLNNLSKSLPDEIYNASEILIKNLIDKKLIYPISLKKSLDPHLYTHNIKEGDNKINSFEKIEIYKANNVKPSIKVYCYNGDNFKTGAEYIIDFRKKANETDIPSIELELKHARGGKATAVICAELDIDNKSWRSFLTPESDKFWEKILNEEGITISDSEKLKNIIKTCDNNNLAKKTISSLYKKFLDSEISSKYNKTFKGFIEFVINCASNCKSSYYIIK